MSSTPAIKDGKVRHFHHKLLGKDWKECYAVLHQDSTFTWLDDQGDHSVKLKDVAPFVAVGPHTKVVPNRPELPKGTTEYHLLAIGSAPDAPANWFLFESDEELNSWMEKIVSTLPSAPPPPAQQQQALQGQGQPRYPAAPPPPYQQHQQPMPQANYGAGQNAPYGYYPPYQQPAPVGAYGQMPPAPGAYGQMPPPPQSTTVIIKDQRSPQPTYVSGGGGGSGLGSGFGGAGMGLAGGMLLGGALGYGLGSLSHPSWGGYGYGGGWGGSPGGYGGGYGGGPSYSDNDTTTINNYYNSDDRTYNNEYNNTTDPAGQSDYAEDSGGGQDYAEETYDDGGGGDDFGGDFDGGDMGDFGD